MLSALISMVGSGHRHGETDDHHQRQNSLHRYSPIRARSRSSAAPTHRAWKYGELIEGPKTTGKVDRHLLESPPSVSSSLCFLFQGGPCGSVRHYALSSAFFMPAQLIRVEASGVPPPCQCVSRLTASRKPDCLSALNCAAQSI